MLLLLPLLLLLTTTTTVSDYRREYCTHAIRLALAEFCVIAHQYVLAVYHAESVSKFSSADTISVASP